MAKTNAKRVSKKTLKRPTKKSAVKSRAAKKPRASKMEMKHIPWDSIPLEDMNPLMKRHFVVGEKIMVARIPFKKGAIVPMHSHHNEQFTYVLEGALKFWIDGKEIIVNAGEVLTIPPHMPHKAEALMDTLDLDVFSPPRADWIKKTDAYLRGGK